MRRSFGRLPPAQVKIEFSGEKIVRVLVTRTDNDMGPFMARLEAMGCTPIAAPMMEIEEVIEPPFDPDKCQAVVTTSANGIRVLSKATDRRDFLVFAVGPASARFAESLGFTNVKMAAGSGKALVGFMRRTIQPTDKPLVYFRADVVQLSIGQELKKANFRTIPRIAYRTKPRTQFNDETLAELNAPTPPEVAVFMSIRGCRLFGDCLDRSGLSDKTSQMIAVSISPAVSDFVRERAWKRVITAADTNGQAILDAIAALKEQADAAS